MILSPNNLERLHVPTGEKASRSYVRLPTAKGKLRKHTRSWWHNPHR